VGTNPFRPIRHEENHNESARVSEEVLTSTTFDPDLTTAASDNPYDYDPTAPISEKVRGKMKASGGGSVSVENLTALDRVPLNIGRNGFVPTQEWVTSWQQG